ncbi:ASCH domain-containing protein [Paenibacillus sp. SYP-B4298]|uniref:ASCH domain-containing protein n=1 Tax=Paenibacillus sp. SYP-B4298 TaxID=2996034 RepID=UPI0022DE970A|nr:ASCH domain-containing protein [Paenibacillus sp. SYP-B4298]
MKAFTVWQPWATLIALLLKVNETRSWPTRYRGPIAIHAGKRIDRAACEREPIKSVLASHGYTADNLPTGAVVATATLAECYPINVGGVTFASTVDENGLILQEYTGNEFMFGNYEIGRYAWRLTDAQMLPEPIPAKGQQGLWNWER